MSSLDLHQARMRQFTPTPLPRVELPPLEALAGIPAVQGAAEAYTALASQLRAARESVGRFEAELSHAREKDLQRGADARRSGDRGVIKKEAPAIDAKLAKAREDVEEIARAISDQAAELETVVASARPNAMIMLAAQEEHLRSEVADVVSMLNERVAALGEIEALSSWITKFPHSRYRRSDRRVPTLLGPNGESLRLQAVLDALRAALEAVNEESMTPPRPLRSPALAFGAAPPS